MRNMFILFIDLLWNIFHILLSHLIALGEKKLQLNKAIQESLFLISELLKNFVDQCLLNNIYNFNAFDMDLLDLFCCIRILEPWWRKIGIIKSNPSYYQELSVLIADFRLCSRFFSEFFHLQDAAEHFSSWYHVIYFYDFEQVLYLWHLHL